MSELSLEAKRAFFARVRYPGIGGSHPVAIETHMSWVFLSGQFAYKFKKPIKTDFLDFSTLEMRRFYCSEELRLNRRLAPQVYLDVLPLMLGKYGQIQLGGQGEAVEWILKMRRLPAACMLDAVIARYALSDGAIRRLVRKLVRFYCALSPEQLCPADYLGRFETRIKALMHELGDIRYAIPASRLTLLRISLERAFGAVARLLQARVHAGMLVEGHGDLRAEHVCMLPSMPIIDCLEFSRDLRILDRVDEVGFLALECERLGAKRAARVLLAQFYEVAADAPAPALVDFYQACRSGMRALLALRHLHDERYRAAPHWRLLAFSYLDLAQGHAARSWR